MAKNMFINTTGLEIEKSVPALTGIDFSGFKPTGLDANIGAVISGLAEKSKTLKEKNNYLKLQSELDKIDDAYKQEYLTDPNIYSTEEGRKVLLAGYNSIVEKKKALLSEAKNGLSADQYTKLSDYFKQQTSSTMFKMQHDINVGYIKETTDNTILETNNILEQLSVIEDEKLRDMKVTDGIELFKNLSVLGIDPTEMQLKFISTAQQRITELEVEKKIVKNYTNQDFYQRDANGKIKMDSNNNPLIDNGKKNAALLQLEKTFLSEDAIKAASKSISQVSGIDYDTVYAYVKNNRQGYWFNIKERAQASLYNAAQIEEAKIQKFEQGLNDSINKRISKLNDNLNGTYYDIANAATGKVYDNESINTPSATKLLTNNQYDDLNGMLKDGLYFKVLPDDVLKNIDNANKDKDITSVNILMTELDNAIYRNKKDLKQTDGTVRTLTSSENMALINIQNKTKIPIGLLKASVGQSSTVTKDDAEMFFEADKQVGDIAWDKVKILQRSFIKSDASNREKIAYNYVVKALLSKPEQYGLDESLTVVDLQKSNPEKINIIQEAYRKNPDIRSKIDSLMQKGYEIAEWNMSSPYQYDVNRGSTLAETAIDTGYSEYAAKYGSLIAKEDIYPTVMGKTTSAPLDENVIKGRVDSFMKRLRNKEFTIDQIDPSNIQNNYFYNEFDKYIYEELSSGNLTSMNVPDYMLNAPLVNKYYRELRERRKQ